MRVCARVCVCVCVCVFFAACSRVLLTLPRRKGKQITKQGKEGERVHERERQKGRRRRKAIFGVWKKKETAFLDGLNERR